jgi:hypothetical protein
MVFAEADLTFWTRLARLEPNRRVEHLQIDTG